MQVLVTAMLGIALNAQSDAAIETGRSASSEPVLTSSKKEALVSLLDREIAHRDRLARLRRLTQIARNDADRTRLKQLDKLLQAESRSYDRDLERLQRELGTRTYRQMLSAMDNPSREMEDRRPVASAPSSTESAADVIPDLEQPADETPPVSAREEAGVASSTSRVVKDGKSVREQMEEENRRQIRERNQRRDEALSRMQNQERTNPTLQERERRQAEYRKQLEERRAQRKANKESGEKTLPQAGDPAAAEGDASGDPLKERKRERRASRQRPKQTTEGGDGGSR